MCIYYHIYTAQFKCILIFSRLFKGPISQWPFNYDIVDQSPTFINFVVSKYEIKIVSHFRILKMKMFMYDKIVVQCKTEIIVHAR